MNPHLDQKHHFEYVRRLNQHYAPLVTRFGDSFRAVDWGSEISQQKRFQILLESVDFLNARILDVGCGVGHLADYLRESGFMGQYTGVDLVPEMVKQAKARYGEFEFVRIDSLDELDYYKPDVTIASGLFTFANQEILQQTICKLFELTSKCVAFNSLSSWANTHEEKEFHADPIKTLSFCRDITRKVVLRHDYLDHDFSIYLYK